MTPLKYLQTELKFNLSEWKTLTKQDQDTMKAWAIEEMNYRNIDIKER